MKIGRVLFGIFIIMVLLIIFGDRGLMDYRTLREKQVTLEEANECTVNENKDLKKEIGLLKSDVRYIEAVARRELGMVKQGDRVYQFID
ncbi:MAG: septum formation initiator family protein [Deltaproteobacteria bacterium]|nr:septum formation initiator family protein [Deltaproteobacteria bacterium]MBW2672930.1 septum formation initiator family protein [Deltaproteobacteria bacterium]